MIVKTGANYQAEGGYIEASKENNIIMLKTENEDIQLPSGGNEYYAVFNVLLRNRTQSSIVISGFHAKGSLRYEGDDIIGVDASTARAVGILKNATKKTYMRATLSPSATISVTPNTIKYVVIDEYGYLEVSPDYNGEDIVVEVSN